MVLWQAFALRKSEETTQLSAQMKTCFDFFLLFNNFIYLFVLTNYMVSIRI